MGKDFGAAFTFTPASSLTDMDWTDWQRAPGYLARLVPLNTLAKTAFRAHVQRLEQQSDLIYWEEETDHALDGLPYVFGFYRLTSPRARWTFGSGDKDDFTLDTLPSNEVVPQHGVISLDKLLFIEADQGALHFNQELLSKQGVSKRVLDSGVLVIGNLIYRVDVVAQNENYILRGYQIGSTFMAGGQGSVSECVRLTDGKAYIAKRISAKVNDRRVLREISMLQTCEHDSIVKLVESFHISSPRGLGDHYLVMQPAMQTTMHDMIKRVKGWDMLRLEKFAIKMLKDIVPALLFMHGKGIMHRDVKPANIGYEPGFMLLDLGHATTDKRATSGTPRFMAPEARDGSSGVKIDVWSLGMTCATLIVGEDGTAETLLAHYRLGRVRRTMKSLLSSMLQQSVNLRMSMNTVQSIIDAYDDNGMYRLE